MKKSEKNSSTAKHSFSAEAKRDLKDIQKYITNEQESPLAAINVIEKILNRIEHLLDFPDTGTLLYPKVNFPTNYRYARAAGYLIRARLLIWGFYGIVSG